MRGASKSAVGGLRRLLQPAHGAATQLVLLSALAAGCGSDGGRPRDLADTPFDVTHGGPDAGQIDDSTGNGGSSSGGTGGEVADSGTPSGDGGTASSQPDAAPAVDLCGNGQLDEGEECDEEQPPNRNCLQVGFEQGVVSCNGDCTWNKQDCSGVETCYDGRDNDGDGNADCDDTETCGSICADACFGPLVVEPNSSVEGTTVGHPTALSSSCGGAAVGSEVAYQVTIAETGKFDVMLSSANALSVSVRTLCGEEATELECGLRTRVTLDVEAGDIYFIIVDGASGVDSGSFLLELTSRQVACGDAIRDELEECDDGNVNDGDGCDPDCNLESSESEPNNTRPSADTYDFQPWFAEIGTVGDVDFFRIPLSAESSTLVVDTLNLGDGACGLNLMDTVVDILDTTVNGNALLATDDDSGDGDCAQAFATGLPPGNYFVRVRAGDGAQPATFPYELGINIGECGDSDVTLGEQCDDGNLVAGDGCDSNCRGEF